MRRRHAFHLRLALAVLAWLAQLCLPVAHAAIMPSAAGDASGVWCGSPASMAGAMAELPDEIRQALGQDGAAVKHLSGCAQLCSASGTLAPPLAQMPVQGLPATGTAGPLNPASSPAARAQLRTPPAQAPPPLG